MDAFRFNDLNLMTNKTKTFRFYVVMTTLLGLNLLILGKAIAQNQVASLDIQPGMLTLAVPTSITFPRFVLVPAGTSVSHSTGGLTADDNKQTMVLPPTNNLQTIEVVDPSNGGQFHLNVNFRSIATNYGGMIAGDPVQNTSPFIPGNNETISIGDAIFYSTNDTILVNQYINGGYEHMRVVSVDRDNNQITVTRGVDNTEINASQTTPIPAGAGFTPRHTIPYWKVGIITLHANPSDSVDTGSINNPPGTNNVSSDSFLNYYYDPANNPVTAFPDSNFTAFPRDTLDPDQTRWDSVSAPLTLMERTIDTPSSGVYSVGWALRVNMVEEQQGGNFTGELTFTLDP